jgi:uncharacterized protein (DUF58 family)
MIDTILQHVTRIPLHVGWLAHQWRLGLHQSRQRGAGLEFDQLLEYQQGETVRKINWAATARRGGEIPFVNTYYEEKTLTVMLLVDMSASMDFGSARLTKKHLTAEISASLVFSALSGHDRIGMLGFAAGVVCYHPPRQCRAYQHAIPHSILTGAADATAANFASAVAALERWISRQALVFVLSDFITDDPLGLEQALMRLSHAHEVIALVVADPLEISFPSGATRLVARDLETGQVRSYRLTRRHQRQMARGEQCRRRQLHHLFQRLGMPCLTVTPQSNYAEDLRHLLLTRHRRASA